MIRKTFTFTCCAALSMAGAAAAQGGRCAPRPQVVAQLTERYGETRRSIGLGADNTMIEVFASDRTGSWTIIATAPDGVTCLVASGQAFETLAGTRAPRGRDT